MWEFKPSRSKGFLGLIPTVAFPRDLATDTDCNPIPVVVLERSADKRDQQQKCADSHDLLFLLEDPPKPHYALPERQGCGVVLARRGGWGRSAVQLGKPFYQPLQLRW